MTTIKAVADAAGVSIATVSRVLNDTKYVSPEIRDKVLQAVRDLNYQPNIPARSLRRQQTQSIGVSLPHLNDAFFSNLAFSVQKMLFEHGFSPLFCSTEDDQDKERTIINLFISNRVDGVILVPVLPIAQAIQNIQFLINKGIPVVLVDRGSSVLKVNQVLCNNYQGGYDAARHLIGLGHRKIGIISSGTADVLYATGPGTERVNGFRQAVRDLDIPFEAAQIGTAAHSTAELGYQATLSLLQRVPYITAIFVTTDMMGVGVLRALFELGITVPRQISVIGFDDIPLASNMIPRLTTIAQPIEQMVHTAGRLLLGQIVDPHRPSETVLLSPSLVVRESTVSLVRTG